jgi:FMN-dependent NADH-azoreductase
MAHVLRIDSSPRAARSHTRRLTGMFVEMWLRQHPADAVSHRDVGLQPLPPVSESWIAAAFHPAAERTAEMRAALSLSDELVECHCRGIGNRGIGNREFGSRESGIGSRESGLTS